MTTQQTLANLTHAGVSIWLDDLDRHRIATGDLARMIDTMSVRGVTTNPSIFEKSVSADAADYVDQISALAATGDSVDEIIKVLTTDDVRSACDLFTEVWEHSKGVDGRVSIEVDPRLAHDTVGTIAAAEQLWSIVDRPNALIKIPATDEGLPAVTAVIAQGISVNVTLIFSVDRYHEVIEAYLTGLELALDGGHNLASIESVASFFISRVDAAVDPLLDDLISLGSAPAARLRGLAAIANAQLAWAAYQESLSTPRWAALTGAGAHPQRPLWASTGVKDPAYPDTRYVIDLVAPGCVNTMPEATLLAVADHGAVNGDTVTGLADTAAQTWDSLSDLGIDNSGLCSALEAQGVQKFIDAWESLRATVQQTMDKPIAGAAG